MCIHTCIWVDVKGQLMGDSSHLLLCVSQGLTLVRMGSKCFFSHWDTSLAPSSQIFKVGLWEVIRIGWSHGRRPLSWLYKETERGYHGYCFSWYCNPAYWRPWGCWHHALGFPVPHNYESIDMICKLLSLKHFVTAIGNRLRLLLSEIALLPSKFV